MKKTVFLGAKLSFLLLFVISAAFAQPTKGKGGQRDYIAIKVYHAATAEQLTAIDQYLQGALLPRLQKEGLRRVGVFTAIDSDTAKDKRMYVFMPIQTPAQLDVIATAVEKSLGDSSVAPDFTRAGYKQAPFARIETIVLRAFEGAPQVMASAVKGAVADRVYELRSYESATEALHSNKVRMFNSGEEEIFQRLGFNPVFYGQVLAGSRMPNLMYMTSFDNKASRDEHWKAFGSDPAWKGLSAKPEFQNNVSHIDITFLRPTAYSGM